LFPDAFRIGGAVMATKLTGGCLCGALRYRIDADDAHASICHCTSCRRAAGAQSVAWGTVALDRFAWTAGTPAAHASSPGIVRTHCPACGTSLTYRASPDSIDVTLGSLDDPEAIVPTCETWLSHRLSWEPVDPSRSAFAQSPDDEA
jgi:hypothetical protein